MPCIPQYYIRVGNYYDDSWGGAVQLVDVTFDLSLAMLNVYTPFGTYEDNIQINKNSSKSFTDGTKVYTIYVGNILRDPDSANYFAQLYMCYEDVVNQEEGFLVMEEFTFLDENNIIIDKALSGEIVHANFVVKNLGGIEDKFWVIVNIGSNVVYNNTFILELNQPGDITKTIITDSWTMPNEATELTISLNHLNSTGLTYTEDNRYEKMLLHEDDIPCVPNWQCEYPLNGYEEDGCGSRRENDYCLPIEKTSNNSYLILGGLGLALLATMSKK